MLNGIGISTGIDMTVVKSVFLHFRTLGRSPVSKAANALLAK